MPRFLPLLTAAVAAFFLSACSHDGQTAAVRTFPMGDKVEVGHLVYRIFDAQWMTQIPQDPAPRIPQQRFLLVRLSADNASGADVLIPGLTLEADGRTYTELSSGEGVPQWIGILRKVKPGDSVRGNVIFDAPPQHYKLRVMDENSEATALVDIPLNLNPEAPPQIAIPQGKKQ